MTDDRAHARRDDPETSHQAADAATVEIKSARRRVELYALGAGPDGFTDAQMCHDLDDGGSTLRSRRSELTGFNIILDTGTTRRFGDSARNRIVWMHRSFASDPPPMLVARDPVGDAKLLPDGYPPDAIRQDAMNMAAEIEGFAASFKREGRGVLAHRLAECAHLLRRLAR